MLLGKRRIDGYDQQGGKCNESRERERERTSKANIDGAINDKLTSSRNGLLVKHVLKNIKKKT